MDKKNQLITSDILLFKNEENRYGHSQLKNFLSFLSSNGIRRPYKFAYIESEGPLIPKLSLRENIHLDSVQMSLSNTKEMELQNLLKKIGNEYLLELFTKINDLESKSSQVNDQTRKVAALIKGLIQEADYLFLERPEKHLSDDNLKLFVKALNYQSQTNGQVIFISSPSLLFWQGKVTKIITRGAKKEFLVTPVIKQPGTSLLPPDKLKNEESNVISLNFDKENLDKKAS
ncbi:MAG: ATP-binding protein [Bacteriovoracaceae bacterium]|nr:ATP-binding protein [Bacteriovoracaceae bacterium]